jgi:hypothetical protein
MNIAILGSSGHWAYRLDGEALPRNGARIPGLM